MMKKNAFSAREEEYRLERGDTEKETGAVI